MTRRLKHIVVGLFLVVVWLGAAANGTVRLKNYDIWKDLPTKTLMEMGKRFYLNDKADSALLCYNVVVNRYYINFTQDSVLTRCAARAMNQLGILYTHYFIDYEKAHKYLLQAERIAKEKNYLNILSAVYNNLASIYLIDCSYKNNGKLDDRTIEYHRKAFEIALEANEPEQILSSAVNLAHIADDSARYLILRDNLIQFLRYQIPDSMNNRISAKYICLAVIEQNRGNYVEAISWYDKAIANVYHPNKRTCDIMKYEILNNKCRLFIKLHQDQKAFDILQECVRHGKETNNHYLQFIYYLSLSGYYHDVKKDSIQSDRYELMALREKDIVLNQNKLLDAEKTEFLFQIDEINAEVQELTTRHRMMKIIAWGIAAFTLLILGFLYLMWRKYKQEQEKNRKLYENNLALLAAEDERRQQIIEAEEHKYQSHQMEEGEQSDLLHRVLYVMETSEEIYDNDFSLDRLTELVDARSSNYVSQVLNGHYHQSLSNVVNEYRIREACRRINDREHYGQITVQGIAQSVGFSSYPNFVSNFKKFTGLTPSTYRKQGKDKAESPSVP